MGAVSGAIARSKVAIKFKNKSLSKLNILADHLGSGGISVSTTTKAGETYDGFNNITVSLLPYQKFLIKVELLKLSPTYPDWLDQIKKNVYIGEATLYAELVLRGVFDTPALIKAAKKSSRKIDKFEIDQLVLNGLTEINLDGSAIILLEFEGNISTNTDYY